MATATNQTIVTVETQMKPVEVEVAEDVVVLTISPEEAGALVGVLALVSGDRSKSRRGLVEDVYSALFDAGYRYDVTDMVGEIAFESQEASE